MIVNITTGSGFEKNKMKELKKTWTNWKYNWDSLYTTSLGSKKSVLCILLISVHKTLKPSYYVPRVS